MKLRRTEPQCLAAVALVLLAGSQLHAQPAPGLSSAEVQRLEAAIERNPSDSGARSKLLDHYYLDKSVDPKDAIAARRRHILWLIKNAPEGELAGTPQATIDLSGHYLADAQGYQLASEAWRAQAAKPGARAAVLTNAAYFFKTNDKEYTVSLLKRALALDPKSKEIGARLGDEYALIILGVTLENRNHYPLRTDRTLTESQLAKSAREALTTSRNPYVLAKAGYMLAWQGTILYASGQIPFEPMPLAISAAERAVSFAPGEQDVAAFRQNVLEFERMARESGRMKNSPPQDRAQAQQRLVQAATRQKNASPLAPGSAEAAAASVHPAATTANVIDLKRITVGMSREDVLKLGTPSGRITTDDDGHLVEIFQYNVNTASAGTVRLQDGIVSDVQIP
ncbi:MAG TPA: hypothetical protein VLY24_19705 [Bryobacteraceae bacterium]|nr:hypothetical protein [Bryobacteraceae bacterium]